MRINMLALPSRWIVGDVVAPPGSLGRIAVTDDAHSTVDAMLRAGPFREAALTHAVAAESRKIGLAHLDPADRFLAATAKVYDLTLVTADERLLESSEFAVFPNR
ncbi:MAG: PIN domain-containing protein [Gemmatimonadetes bacterium]|nr:PIN domain-containing protein [Gemmatimonadota bacterium]